MEKGRPRRVLIVEDDPGIVELIRERLEDLGHVCRSASSGAAAISEIRFQKPELLILDYSLPDMDAEDLITSTSLPPFIVATGRGDELTAVRLMRAGARDYLIKGTSFLDELPTVVERVFREIDTERGLAEAQASLEARLREKEALLVEKDLLIKEVHHRVKNNLQILTSLVVLQRPQNPSAEVEELLKDLQGRIAAMALVHESLYMSEDLARIDFLAYLDRLSGTIGSIFQEDARGIRIICTGETADLPVDKAVPLGLIANELIVNAFKHAFPRADGRERWIRLGVSAAEDGDCVLEIEDNGIGFEPAEEPGQNGPASFKPRGYPRGCSEGAGEGGHEGLGLKLVAVLAEQLKASLRRESGAGTLWRIGLKA